MVVTLRKLLQDIKKEERQRYNAEIQALQAQINPHFLYNTLNVIRWLSMMNENEKINSMIISLVKLLEYTREDLSVFVPIEREIEHVRKYVQVMSIRYDGKFQFIEELDSELLQMYTIRFVLQPLVENAIFHGIDPSESKGVIMLKIHRIENRITFSVSDDGVGFDIEKNRHRFFSGYGITNVNDRLRRQFGSQSMIQVFSEVGKGTWVEFSIPCITEIPQEDDNDDTIAHC